MIVNAAIFTCSICGEPSVNICAYCTKDACGNHRCERCKRCSDCCECDVPLSAEEPVPMEIAVEAAPEVIGESISDPEAEVQPAEILEAENPPVESFEPDPRAPQFTAAELSVFIMEDSTVPDDFAETPELVEPEDSAQTEHSPEPHDPSDPLA